MESRLPVNKNSPPPAKIGRPPQWTDTRSRKLARLYMYTTLPIKKIIKVLEDGRFKPGANSAQKTLHNMLGHDPRYLRPEDREEMNERIGGLSVSNSQRNSCSPRAHTKDNAAQVPRSRAEDSVQHTTAPDGEVLEGAISFGNERHAFPESAGAFTIKSPSPFGKSQISSQPSPLHIDTAWSSEGSVAYGSPPSGLVESQLSYQAAVFAPKPLKHTGTMFSASTTASTSSLRILKQRMSISSTHFAKQVSSLMRQWTIGSEANLVKVGTNRIGSASNGSSIKPLPGDFFNAYNASEHEPDRWQDVIDVLPKIHGFWVTPSGELSDAAKRCLEKPVQGNFGLQDCFGNTLLHLLASFIPNSDFVLYCARLCTSEQLCSTNTADQTFLHVLSSDWFHHLDGPSAPLLELLFHVLGLCPAIVTQRDVYGRTFFHHLQDMVADPAVVSTVLQKCDPSLLPRRDALDRRPVMEGGSLPSLHAQALSPLPEEVVGSPVSASLHIQQMDMFTEHHAGLLRTVRAAYANPAVEDACGRNGLHCLAEVVLGDEDTLQERHSSLNSNRPPKRKYDQRSGVKLERGGSADGSGGDGTPADEGPQARRLALLQGLLGCSGIDVNHYDRSGSTVLMAFIERLTEQDEDRHRTLASMLQLLILEGGARVESRNARGETALLLAARLGRKTALRVLLEWGAANVHARDAEGRGVLEIIDEATSLSRSDTQLYGRLQACRVLLTGRYKDDWGGHDVVCQSPTVLDEWRVWTPRPAAVMLR